MIIEKYIVNSICCGLNWAFLIVLQLWWVQEMFTESTELALIQHVSIWVSEVSDLGWEGNCWLPPLRARQWSPIAMMWKYKTLSAVTSLIWAMNDTCKANRDYFHRENSTGFTTMYDPYSHSCTQELLGMPCVLIPVLPEVFHQWGGVNGSSIALQHT